MGQINNLRNSQLPAMERRVRQAGTATPMNSAAVGSGGFEVYDGGVITISNGGLSVTGTANIIGTLIASGVINFTGTVTISGPLTVSGLTTVTNNLVVASGGKITAGTIELSPDGSAKFGTFLIDPAGKVTVANDLNVTTGGKVKVGTEMTLTPATDGGAVTFTNGAKMSSGSGGNIQMITPGGSSSVSAASTSAGISSGTASAVVFNDGTWRIGNNTTNVDGLTAGRVSTTASTVNLTSGTRQVNVTSTGTAVTGPFSVSNISTLSGPLINSGMTDTTNGANCWVSTGYQLYRVTSASRFKVDPQPMDLPDSLLDVPVKDWWDAGEVERGEQKRRIPGVIAEEVEASGGDAFVTYDEDGVIQGVSYDRYALARTAVLARKLDAALTKLDKAVARIKELEDAA